MQEDQGKWELAYHSLSWPGLETIELSSDCPLLFRLPEYTFHEKLKGLSFLGLSFQYPKKPVELTLFKSNKFILAPWVSCAFPQIGRFLYHSTSGTIWAE